jgi:hypothetical protein
MTNTKQQFCSEFGAEYHLVLGDIELNGLRDCVGQKRWDNSEKRLGYGRDGWASAFVLVGDAEYLEVWVSASSVAWNTSTYYRIV